VGLRNAFGPTAKRDHPMPPKPTIVIIGAGFAGIQAAKGLRRSDANVILIDRHNHHVFQPLLYQVATAGLSPADIAYPIRRIFRSQKNVAVGMGEVKKIDLAGQRIYFNSEEQLRYDYLVVAAGATHSYFGKESWQQFAPGLKSLDDATEIRKRVLIAFEEAEYEADEASRRAKLTFVVIGGGPTGVEMAGALREIAAQEIQRDFRNIDTTTSRIILLQGGDRLLPAMHPKLSARAKNDLEKMGVIVRLNARVTDMDATGLWIGTERLDCQNMIWAAGVQAAAVNQTLGVELDKAGRVVVGPDLTIAGHDNVFVVGDAANVTDPKTKQPVPGLAPAAMQMGRYVAKVIGNEVARRGAAVARPQGGHAAAGPVGRPAFHYLDKGALATIGKAHAVAEIRGWRFTGLFAWLLWCFIHVMFLISFRSKLFVIFGWMYDYLFNSREARLITGKTHFQVHTPRLPQ
jgi:NADH dehydrogenase